ncbi:MAG TPA: alpha/beta hydrolase-fold protein [Thermoanaerobaculia bacterium]|nr:alpha/beta hydrolase-fold protein [Thermoanaerobaculia bacterium]
MNHRLTIRVHYPLSEGRLALRTEGDWDADVEPAAVAADGTRFDFELDLVAPFLYFKPVLRRGGEVVWSRGENLLAFASGRRDLSVSPFFFSDEACNVCTLERRPAARSGRSHALRVFLPPGYAENTLARYPVLYMQDGQNLFFAGEAFGGHHWMIEETLHILEAMNLVRKAIVVGVYPEDRMADYTRPGYEEYGRYLAEEVKPWVDASYRTLPGPADTVAMGSSLGGVVSLYLAWQWPEVFGNAGCLSSTFGWRDDLHERIESEPKPPIKIYLDSGWPRDNYEVTRTMRNTLRAHGFREGQDLFYLAFPRARHDEQSWAMRAHVPFQFFFSD